MLSKKLASSCRVSWRLHAESDVSHSCEVADSERWNEILLTTNLCPGRSPSGFSGLGFRVQGLGFRV